jgi:uncharacterized membrane protein YdfJ with MMPL/SSD domain
MEKEDKAVWVGVITVVIVGLISNLYFKIPWFPTLAIACAIGVIIGLIARKLFGMKK